MRDNIFYSEAMKNKKVSGKARGMKQDAAEKWLLENDPEYAERKRSWTPRTTDALSVALSERNAPHSSLKDWEPAIDESGERTGNYRRKQTNGRAINECSEADLPYDVLLEDDYSEDSKP